MAKEMVPNSYSLEHAGYALWIEFGKNDHNMSHGGSLFADWLQWLMGPATLAGTTATVAAESK